MSLGEPASIRRRRIGASLTGDGVDALKPRRPQARFVALAGMFFVSAIAGAWGYWYLEIRRPSLPSRPLRIGFEQNAPYQIRTESGLSGLAVDIVKEAARRSGIRLEWVETGTSADEAFQRGLVDLWPLMADVPERRGRVYISQVWLHTSHVLLLRAGAPVLNDDFAGRIAITKLPLMARQVRKHFPQASTVPVATGRNVAAQVCFGTVTAGMLERRVAVIALTQPAPECAGVPLRIQPISDLSVSNGIGSTFETARAADILRQEIGRMYRDGSLETVVAKYSFYGLDDTWTTYELLQQAERNRWITWGIVLLAGAVFVVIRQWRSLAHRNRAERVLRESEERFRSIFQQAGVGVAQLSMDGKLELANDQYCDVVGHSRDYLHGNGTVDISHREDLQEQLAMLPRLMKGEIQSFSTEKRYIRDDGAIVWAEMCKSLVRDADGKPKYFIAIVKDITERKKVEAALKESEARFRNMADSAHVLIWVSGPDGQRTFFSRSWLEFTGRTIEQEQSSGWLEGVQPGDRERCAVMCAQSFDSRENFHLEYNLLRADGEYRCVLDHGVVRFSPDGEFAGYIGSCIDITDLKRSYEQHLAAQKLESLGVLATGVAHDFNNLLGAILASAEAAKSELPSGSPATEDVIQIHDTALRAAEIVSRLMTFAHQEIAPATVVDLSSLVAETVDLLNVSIGKSAVVKTELSTSLPLIHVNAAEIRQVIMNLALNASEALDGRAGTITISTSRVAPDSEFGAGVRLEVKDDGSGMSEEVKARAFDPFFTTRFTGRGLGLAAVQGIVRSHGGVIEVESAPGKGSRFTVLLPCEARPTEEGTVSVEPEADADIEPSTVLLVEDEESLRTVVAKSLRRKSFRVIEAADGAAAIESLKSDPAGIGLVLLDVTLPGISGTELLDALCDVRPDLKVILSTAYSRETAMREFGGRDVWGFIRKPYRTGDLVKLLRKAAGAPVA